MTDKPIVFIVDDDNAVRTSLSFLLGSVHLETEVYDSAQTFLQAHDPSRPGCLILDVRMPNMTGMQLLERLDEHGVTLPVIMISGHGDVPMAVHAIKQGAVDFLPKPFSDEALLERVYQAIEHDAAERARRAQKQDLEYKLALLTPRERDILEGIVAGRPNKVIADTLNISAKTVETHRAMVMKKLGVRSVAELVQMVLTARSSGER